MSHDTLAYAIKLELNKFRRYKNIPAPSEGCFLSFDSLCLLRGAFRTPRKAPLSDSDQTAPNPYILSMEHPKSQTRRSNIAEIQW